MYGLPHDRLMLGCVAELEVAVFFAICLVFLASMFVPAFSLLYSK